MNMLPLLHRYVHRATGSYRQVVYRVGFDRLAGDQVEAGALGKRGEQQVALHHGEVEANADARPRSEGDVGIARKLLLPFRREALGIETLGLWEVLFASMQCVGREQDDSIFGHSIAIDLDITQGSTRGDVGWRIETHCLFEDLQAVG